MGNEIIFTAIYGVLIIVFVYKLVQRLKYVNNIINNGKLRKGAVVDVHEEQDNEHNIVNYPMIEINNNKGEKVKIATKLGSYLARYEKGQTVEVYVDKTNDKDFIINSFFYLWGEAFIYVMAIFIFTFIYLMLALSNFEFGDSDSYFPI